MNWQLLFDIMNEIQGGKSEIKMKYFRCTHNRWYLIGNFSETPIEG